METPTVAVIGGGSWATAIVKMLLNNVSSLNWWMRNDAAVQHIRTYRHNPNYLQSVELPPDKLNATTNLREAIEPADLVIVAIPAAFLHEALADLPRNALEGKTAFSAIKGIVPEYHHIPARYLHKEFGVPYSNIGIISGPCHAEEVALERLSYLTIACQDQAIAGTVANLLACRYIKTNLSDDIFGTEFSAILKNIFAIASGMCHALGYGDNFQAVLISNALNEIERFVDAVHPIHRDVKESAYLGDLLVTAYSNFSRNRIFGTMIGHGYSVRAAQLEMNMVAEGYYAASLIRLVRKKHEVKMPIANAVYKVLYEGKSPRKMMAKLAEKLD